MEAIKFMLDTGRWQLVNGQILTSSHQRVASPDFTTGEMHCGWCTLFLRILDLPLGRPSDGNFNQAVNLNYPLPPPIRDSPHVLARLLRTNALAMSCLKSVFDKCLNTSPTTWVVRDFDNTLFATDGQGNPYMIDRSQLSQGTPVLSWDFLIGANKDLLDAIWKFVFDCIYKSMR